MSKSLLRSTESVGHPVLIVLDSKELSRRLRAARALAGLTVQELADKLNEPGLGFKTLGAIERGERTIRRRELFVLAEALELPPAFFTLSRDEMSRRLQDVVGDRTA